MPYGMVVDEWWVGMDLTGSGRGLIEVLSQDLLEETKESHE
jgi:hypothetical protein